MARQKALEGLVNIRLPALVLKYEEGFMQQRYKGNAGMGGRGKDSSKRRQDKATARKVRVPKLPAADIPGAPESKNPRKRNQKRNQREWHTEKHFKVRKATHAPAPNK